MSIDPSLRRQIEGQLEEAKSMLAALQSGEVTIAGPFDGRQEAKKFHLRRQIGEWQALLDRDGREAR
jgi:hypothetical protein